MSGKIILILILGIFFPVNVFAMPTPSNMVSDNIKSVGGNLYKINGEYINLIKNKNLLVAPSGKIINPHKWQKTYTVTFDGMSQTVIKGKDAKEPEVKKEGFTFSGWDKKFSNIQSNTDIKSQWIPKKYHVIFKDGNNVLKEETVEYGQKANPPEIINEEERIFLGWDKDLIIKSDMIFTAKWKAKEYVVKIGDREVKTEYMKDISLYTPEKEGFIFLGWDKDGKEIIDNTVINPVWKKDDGLVHFTTIRKPRSTEDSSKIQNLKNEILDNLDKNKKYFADYTLLKKTRETINAEYFYYYSMLDCGINQENGKYFIEIKPSKDRKKKNEYIQTEIEKITNSIIKENMKEEDAINSIMQWFNNNFSYKEGEFDLYEALKNKQGNCNAYSQIAQAICDYAGIDCRYVTGYVPQGYHAWNRVKLNNEWHYVDFTWGLPPEKELSDHVPETEKYYFEK